MKVLKVGEVVTLENGYKATIKEVIKPDGLDPFIYRGEVDARSGIIEEWWKENGYQLFHIGFAIEKKYLEEEN